MACETLRWIVRWDFTVLCHSRLIALGTVRIRIPFLERTLTALAILFLSSFSFSIFLHFLPSRLSSLPFLQSDVPRMAKTAGDSLAAPFAQKPKLHRSAAETAPNTWRAIRVGSLWLRLQLIFSRDGLRFVVRESFKADFVFTFLFSFSFYICEFFSAFSLQPAELSRVAVAAGFAQVLRW